jgi:hypothetical protein
MAAEGRRNCKRQNDWTRMQRIVNGETARIPQLQMLWELQLQTLRD